jgi:cell volume regulation protein A
VTEAAPLVIVAVLLLLLGLLASKVSGRLGVPALLLFLGLGMLAGSEGPGGIAFDDFEVAQAVGVVALAFILYSGGLDTEWRRVRGLLGPGIALATAGTLVTGVVVGLAAAWILGLSLTAGLLLGSVVSSTDAAAVFSILRSREVSLKGDLRPLLELESGSNDPMAVFLTLGCLELLTEPATGAAGILMLFVAQMGVGLAVGLAVGFGSVWAINRIRLGFEGLYPVGLIATVLLAYGAADLLHGSGFLAVYTAGLVMSRSHFLHKKSLMRFADGLAWLMQIAMFLVLGLLVFPSQLAAVAGRALLIGAVLILVARPLAVIPLLAPTRFTLRETGLLSWVGLRGAVPIVLATFPLVRGIPQAALIFNVVFFVVLMSVLVQGTTVPVVARWLRLDAPSRREKPPPLQVLESAQGTLDLHEIAIPDGSPAAGRRILDLDLPEEVLVVVVSRADGYVMPQGATVLLSGDRVLVLSDASSLPRAEQLLTGRG